MIARPDGSPVWVPETVPAILARAVAERPDALALLCGEARLTYREYDAAVQALARRLVAAGAGGGHVALVLRNGIDLAVALFAVHCAGATAVPLNPDYTAAELDPMFADTRPPVTITHADLAERIAPLASPHGALWIVEEPGKVDETIPLPALSPDAIATVQFTGGTTGRPKGVRLSHRAIATNIAQREAVLPTDFGDERIVCMMPLFHSFAIAMGLHLAAYAAGTLHILPRYRPDWVVETIARERITRLPAGPTVFNSLLAYEGLNRAALGSLRCAYSGSAPLPQETLSRWEAATGVPIYEGYGQSEAGPILSYHGPDMVLKQGSVGPALPGTTLRIDGDGPLGEVLARGPQIMAGYLDRPEETAQALADGWLHTGDIGRIDADGYLFIEDRKKDMAIVGGYNVYPREIDEVLMRHPAVREAAAIGVPDAYRGEIVWAYVVADGASEAALLEHCAQSLVRYKHPARIHLVEALPRTGIGKVDKPALRELAQAMRAQEASRVA